MVFRNTLFRRQVAKHRALVLIVSAHTTKTFGNVLMSRGNLLFQQRLKAAAGMIGRPAKRHSRKQVRSSQQASTRVDAARTSACATSEMRSSQRSKKLSCCDTEQGWQAEACPTLPRRLPLKRFLSSVIHIQEPEWTLPRTGMDCILGVDAGSTP